jgi:hypothetical protein
MSSALVVVHVDEHYLLATSGVDFRQMNLLFDKISDKVDEFSLAKKPIYALEEYSTVYRPILSHNPVIMHCNLGIEYQFLELKAQLLKDGHRELSLCGLYRVQCVSDLANILMMTSRTEADMIMTRASGRFIQPRDWSAKLFSKPIKVKILEELTR